MPNVTSSGPTQTAKTEVDAQRWAARPSTARVLRFAMFLAPLVGSLLIAFWAAANFPPDRLGLNRWVWWLGLAVVSTAIVRILERAIGHFTPIATLFQLSLVFPDQAPSRFSMALRAGSARSLQRRLDEIRESGEAFSPEDSYAQQMLDLIRMLSEHDRMTRGHAERVRAYSELIGEEMGLDSDDLDKLRWGALLHDMGKLDVPSEILNKEGRPTEEEWAILQAHPAAALPYLAPLKAWLGDWIHAADGHHERWDGGGYPAGLAGTEIPLSARIVAVADAFDVMTSTRSYKKAMPLELGRQEVADKAGSQFDPEVARAFLKVSLGDVRRAAGPLAWFTGLPGLQHIPIGAASSQAVTTLTAATAVAVTGATGIVAPEPTVPPPAVAFVEPASVEVADITIDEDTVGVITVDLSGVGPAEVTLTSVPPGSQTEVGPPNADDDGTSIPITFAPGRNDNGTRTIDFTACVGETCFDERVTVTVMPVNDAPTIASGPLTLDRGAILPIPLIQVEDTASITAGRNAAMYVYDADGDQIRIVDVTRVVRGSSTFTDTTATFRHDRSAGTRSSLDVTISDGTARVTATLPVDVINTNVFPRLVVGDTSVEDSRGIGHTVFTLLATDPDGDVLTYALDDPSGTFRVNARTGAVTIARPLDATSTPSHVLTATVTDEWGDSTSDEFTITVLLDNRPPTISATGAFAVSEDATPGTVIGAVSATDADADDDVTFTLDDPTGSFSIDPDSGRITLASPVDHEVDPSIPVAVTATDGRGGTTSTTITITVTDVNEPPVVTAPTFALLVSEQAAVGSALGTVEARDPDGDSLTYSLPSTATAVRIDAVTGQLTLAQRVDYETTPPFDFTVTVTDSGSPTRSTSHVVRVVVRDADEPVTIQTTRVNVAESSPPGSVVGRIAATDPEGAPLSFSLVGSPPKFAIDSATGDLSLTGPVDHESTASYAIDVRVSDGTTSATKRIIVTIDDVNEAPGITSGQSFVVDETAPMGDPVGTVTASDPEGSVFVFAISSGNTGGAFAIDPDTGTLQVSGPLDYEVTPSFTLGITVTETGPNPLSATRTVTILVDDGSESPSIADQTLTTPENEPAGTSIGFVAATDPDASDTLTYTITAGNDAGLFDLASDTGELTTNPGSTLDHEDISSYDLTVEVSDGTFFDTGVITVDVTNVDEAPAVTSPVFSVFIREDSTAPSVTQAIASDPEGDAATFSIVGGNTDSTFAINPGSGVVTVAGTLDADTEDTFRLVVRATQSSDPALFGQRTVNIVVQDVDEPPTIDSLPTLSVREDVPNGFSMGLVGASDPEGENLTFSTDSSIFLLGASQDLRVFGSLDFESTPEYTFDIVITDEADPDALETRQTVTVQIIDVDEPAEFGATGPLAVDENAPGGTVVGTIVAADPDTGDSVEFAISNTYGASPFPFTIDPVTGDVRVFGTVDHEAASDYTFEVEISSGPATATDVRDFTVTVNDVNEAPVIAPGQNWQVNEAEPVGHVIGTVAVSDDDTPPSHSFSITAGNAGGEFAIADSGELTVASQLDFESVNTYTLEITLDDGPFTTTETITVDILDGPEPPVLTVTPRAPLQENAPIGTIVADFDATDPDATGTITFAITSTEPHPFALDPDTGELTVDAPIDYETPPTNFDITVEAFDGTQNSTPVTINIPVENVNEAPTAQTGQAFTIAENESTTPIVYTFQADDVDSGDPLTYTITGGTAETLFRINGSNGRIRYNGGLDYNEAQTHTLEVTATDQAGLTAVETIDITVTSRFTLSPHFGQIVFNEVIYHDTTPDVGYVEFMNITDSTIITDNWSITDHEFGTAGDEAEYTFNFLDDAFYYGGEIGTEEIELFSGQPGRDPLALIDDIWMWDDQGRLVAYMAWGDADAPGSQITSRPPIDAWGLWTTDYEIELGATIDRQSISRTPHGSSSTTSACWERTTTGDALASGRCPGALVTLDTSGPRMTSLNEVNTIPRLVISEIAVNGMNSTGDFIEIMNVDSQPLDLEKIRLELRYDADVTEVFSLTNTTQILQPGQHMLFAEKDTMLGDGLPGWQRFENKVSPEFGIRLRLDVTNGTPITIDAVGNQASAHNGLAQGMYVEGTGLADPYDQGGHDLSYERLHAYGSGNCVDTDDNSEDFIRNFAPGAVNPETLADPAVPCSPPEALPGPADHLVIREYRTDGPNGGDDEFIEFFNPTDQPIDVTGYTYEADGSLEYTFPNITLQPGQHWLVADTGGYTGPVDDSYNGISNGTNTLEIYDDGGVRLDVVNIDSGGGSVPRTEHRYEATIRLRANGCAHTDDDSDYTWGSTPTPKTSASPLEPCS